LDPEVPVPCAAGTDFGGGAEDVAGVLEASSPAFAYLDAEGDGSISYKEWTVLEQLWHELGLSLVEFAKCVSRPFEGSLEKAFAGLDEDGNGYLDEQEWMLAAEKFHFHGPSKEVFQFLDQDGAGAVTLDKFLALKDQGAGQYHRRKAVAHVVAPDTRMMELQKQLQENSEIAKLIRSHTHGSLGGHGMTRSRSYRRSER